MEYLGELLGDSGRLLGASQGPLRGFWEPLGDFLDNALTFAEISGHRPLRQDVFVRNLSDMASWLQILTSGIFRHVWLVVPYVNQQVFEQSNLRQLLDTL